MARHKLIRVDKVLECCKLVLQLFPSWVYIGIRSRPINRQYLCSLEQAVTLEEGLSQLLAELVGVLPELIELLFLGGLLLLKRPELGAKFPATVMLLSLIHI